MSQVKIMGVLNATPDSYHIDSRRTDLESALSYGISMWKQGADIIDVGGESTRPGAPPVSLEEELQRVIPIIKELVKAQPLPISVDTMKPEVAEQAIAAGASMINDITGFQNPKMRELAAGTNVMVCAMHMQGTPRTMQEAPFYRDGVTATLLRWFDEVVEKLIASGINEKQIILDPGIGFGKTVADNLEIIHNLPRFKAIGFPVLIGLSRKSFIQRLLGLPPAEILSATLAMNTIAIQAGVEYIRVHDVKEHRQAIDILQQYGKHTSITCSYSS